MPSMATAIFVRKSRTLSFLTAVPYHLHHLSRDGVLLRLMKRSRAATVLSSLQPSASTSTLETS
jgi:hypothetical protein